MHGQRLAFDTRFAVCAVHAACRRETSFAAPELRRSGSDGGFFLQLLIEGEGRFYAGGDSACLTAGQAMLLHSACAGEVGWLSPTALQAISIDVPEPTMFDWLGERSMNRLRTALHGHPARLQCMPLPAESGWAALRTALASSDEVDEPLARLAIEGAAMHVVARLLGQPCDHIDHRRERAVLRAHQRLLGAIDHPLNLAALAAESGLPVRRFTDLYRQRFGCSPFQTVLRARLDRAFDELRAGQKPIKTAAWRAGYRHASSFTHAFRQRFGMNPDQVTRGAKAKSVSGSSTGRSPADPMAEDDGALATHT